MRQDIDDFNQGARLTIGLVSWAGGLVLIDIAASW